MGGLDAEQAHHLIQADTALAARGQLHPIGQVAADGQVREQTTVLKNITDGALFRRQVDAVVEIEKNPVSDDDAAPVRRIRPATMLITDVLPAPDGPKSAVMPVLRVWKAAST